jgi:hypothetical protein
MSKEKAEKATAPRQRALTSFQSTGRMGQSILKQGLISWFGFASIPFRAIDADSEHKTLARWYPEYAIQKPFLKEDDLLPILNEAGEAPIRLIDFPSQHTQSILAAFEHFDALNLFAGQATRLTVFIFANNERPAMNSAHQILTAFGEEADYLVVRNPARFDSNVFEASIVGEMLRRLNAPAIEIPRITPATMEILDRASRQKKRALTFREAEPFLEIGSRYELEHWRNRLFAQFEDVAHLLLPDPALIQARVQRPRQKKLVAVDPYDL